MQFSFCSLGMPLLVSRHCLEKNMIVSIDPESLYGQNETFERVNKTIATGDGMYVAENKDHYFIVGASALASITECIDAAGLARSNIKRILDYACGYGRVLRWLQAGFTDAYLLGVDADPKAVTAAQNVLGVETRRLDTTLTHAIDSPFDLIWVGSLFTHLPKSEMARVLLYLSGHLTAGGVLVFTTHGRIVEQRLKSRSRTYNLSADMIPGMLDEFRVEGFAFSEYPGVIDYGISIVRPSHVALMIEDAGMNQIFFKDRGWAVHQDVSGAVVFGG